MHTAVAYLGRRFVYRIGDFIRHWYRDSSLRYWHGVISLLERLDYQLAWKITLHNLFTPMYGDYSVIGYILGFIFRILRLLLAGVVYIVIFILAVALFAVWALIPPALIVQIFIG